MNHEGASRGSRQVEQVAKPKRNAGSLVDPSELILGSETRVEAREGRVLFSPSAPKLKIARGPSLSLLIPLPDSRSRHTHKAPGCTCRSTHSFDNKTFPISLARPFRNSTPSISRFPQSHATSPPHDTSPPSSTHRHSNLHHLYPSHSTPISI